MSLERQPIEKVIKQNQNEPLLNIIDINPLRSEMPGSLLAHVEERQEWSPVMQIRKAKHAPAVIKLASVAEANRLISTLCKTNKRTGALRLPELIVEKAS
jgi:hypothetical protein